MLLTVVKHFVRSPGNKKEEKKSKKTRFAIMSVLPGAAPE